LGGTDNGIDWVAQTRDGDYWTVQCKCFDENTYIYKHQVDSFLSNSSRSFTGADNQTRAFACRLWVSTTNKWSANAEEAIKN
jgi:predicted helicase